MRNPHPSLPAHIGHAVTRALLAVHPHPHARGARRIVERHQPIWHPLGHTMCASPTCNGYQNPSLWPCAPYRAAAEILNKPEQPAAPSRGTLLPDRPDLVPEVSRG